MPDLALELPGSVASGGGAEAEEELGCGVAKLRGRASGQERGKAGEGGREGAGAGAWPRADGLGDAPA